MAPRAFVLMPFAAEFDEIYNLFIADSLTDAGYTVQRADDFLHQRNILQDVVAGIAGADLIVADLTGANPNVYYELGIAHALQRRVVLLTQSIESLPFDLRSYRVISYNTHFAAIRSAREALQAAAQGAIDGSISFSNPISDYLPGASDQVQADGASFVLHDDDDEPGFLDHMVRLDEGFTALGEVLNGISERTAEINQHTEQLTDRLPKIIAEGKPGSAKRARDLVRAYSDQMAAYARSLKNSVAEYRARQRATEGALQAILEAQAPATAEECAELREFLTVLQGVEDQAFAGRTSFSGLADVMAESPKLEQRLDRARKEAVSELRRLVESIDETIASVSQAKSVGARILRANKICEDSEPETPADYSMDRILD